MANLSFIFILWKFASLSNQTFNWVSDQACFFQFRSLELGKLINLKESLERGMSILKYLLCSDAECKRKWQKNENNSKSEFLGIFWLRVSKAVFALAFRCSGAYFQIQHSDLLFLFKNSRVCKKVLIILSGQSGLSLYLQSLFIFFRYSNFIWPFPY